MYAYLDAAITYLTANLDAIKSAAPDGVPTPDLEALLNADAYPSPPPPPVAFALPSKQIPTCITLMEPVMQEHYLDRHVIDDGGWTRSEKIKGENTVGDYGITSFCRMEGGFKACDSKGRWTGKPGDGPFKVQIVVPEKYVVFPHPYGSGGLSNKEQIASNVDMEEVYWHVVVGGKDLPCLQKDLIYGGKLSMNDRDLLGEGGCVVETGPGKHLVEIHTDKLPEGRLIVFDSIVGV